MICVFASYQSVKSVQKPAKDAFVCFLSINQYCPKTRYRCVYVLEKFSTQA